MSAIRVSVKNIPAPATSEKSMGKWRPAPALAFHARSRFAAAVFSTVALTALGLLPALPGQSTWTGATSNSWDTGTNWSSGTEPTAATHVLFPGAVPGTGSTIALTAGELASQISFLNSYTLSGGDLTITTSQVAVNSGFTATIGSTLLGTAGFTKSGGGTLTLTGSNGFTGNVTVVAGMLKAGGGNSMGAAGNTVGVASGATFDINGFGNGNFDYNFNIAGTGTAGQGALINSGINGNIGFVNNPNVNLAGNASVGGTGDIYQIASGYGTNNLALNGFTFTKVGSNKYWLVNTTVSAGTIDVTSGALGVGQNTNANASAATINLANTAGVVLDLNNQGLQVGVLTGGGTTGGGVTLGAGGGSNLLVLGSASSGSYAGAISGGGAVLKIGTGTQILSGANTYLGGTFINGGTLQSANSGALISTSSVAVSNAGSTLAVNYGGAADYNQVQLAALLVKTTFGTTDTALAFDTTNAAGAVTYGNNLTMAAGLTKLGAGTLVLTGTNNYTGGTTVSAGTLNIANPVGLGTGPVSVAGGSFLNLSVASGSPSYTLGTLSGAGTINLATTGGSSTTVFNNYAVTAGFSTGFTGTLNVGTVGGAQGKFEIRNPLGTGATINVLANSTLYASVGTINSALTLNGGDTGESLGQLRIEQGAVYSGNITLAGNISGAGDSTVGASGGIGTISGVIGESGGSRAFSKGGAGTTVLSGANTYTGVTTVNAGTLRNGSAATFTSKGDLAMAGSGIFELNGFNAAVTTISASSAASTITNNGAANARLTLSDQPTLNHTISSLITDGGGGGTMAVRVANQVSSNSLFTLSNQNTFSGGLTLLNASGNGTRLRIDSSITTTGPAGAIVSGPFGRAAITIGLAATDKAGIYFSSVLNNTMANDIVFNTELGNDFDGIRVNATANGLVLSGKITANLADARFSGGGSLSLTGQVTGPSGLELSNLELPGANTMVTLNNTTANANNYQGNTVVRSESTLVLGAANQLPNGAGTGNVTNNGTLRLGGFSETINGLSGAGIVDGTSGTPTLTLGDNNATGTTFSGQIINTAGTLGLIKTGTGTHILSGTNTYTGVTTVSNGILQADVNQALGTAAGGTTVASGAALRLNGVSYSTAEPLTINGTGVSGGGALVNVGTSSYAGQVTAATNATINTGGGSLTFTGGLVKNGTVLTLTGGGTVNVNSAISGSLANSDLIVDATTTNLNAANTYTGPTFIRNNGVLNANVTGALPVATRTAVTFDGGGASTLNLGGAGVAQEVASLGSALTSAMVNLNDNTLTVGAASGTTTYAGTISGAGGTLAKDGASTQALGGANTYTGFTFVTGGTLLVNNATGSGTGTGLFLSVDAGATLGGTGSIGNVQTSISGTIAPGDPAINGGIESLAFTGELFLNPGSVSAFQLQNPSNHDQLLTNLTTNGGGTLNLTFMPGFVAAPRDFFKLIDSGSTVAPFTASNFGTPADGQQFAVTSGGANYIFEYDYNGVNSLGVATDATSLSLLVVVPEPSRAVLLLLAGVGIMGRRRPKRA